MQGSNNVAMEELMNSMGVDGLIRQTGLLKKHGPNRDGIYTIYCWMNCPSRQRLNSGRVYPPKRLNHLLMKAATYHPRKQSKDFQFEHHHFRDQTIG